MYPQLSCRGIVGSFQLRWDSLITFVRFCRKSLEKWPGRWSLSRNETAGVWASFCFYCGRANGERGARGGRLSYR